MELRHLRYFTTVAKELSFSRAADELYISQPALSRQIKNLEDELGVALFLRQPGGLLLTEAGRFLLEQSQDILHRSNEVVQNIQARFGNTEQALVIGYFAALMKDFLSDVLSCLSSTYPKLNLTLREMLPAEQIKALRSGEIDIAFSGSPPKAMEEEFEVATVKRLSISVVLPKAHPLAKQFSVNLADFATEDFISVSDTTFPGCISKIRDICRQAGFTPKMSTFTDTPTSVTALVAARQGIGLMAAESAAIRHPEVVLIPLHYPVVYSRSVAMWRKETPTDALNKLLKVVFQLQEPVSDHSH